MQPSPLFIGAAINLEVKFKAEPAQAPDQFMITSPVLQYGLKELVRY